jgi:glycosyltransferase involved in cell wall biosynthesis
LRNDVNFDVYLLKGHGDKKLKNELVVNHLPRQHPIAKTLAWITGRHPFYFQNMSFVLGMIAFLRKYHPEVIYIGEPVVYSFLNRWRKWSNQRFRIIFFTGGQTFPVPFDSRDVLHHVTPMLTEKAEASGIADEKQFFIPHFNLHDETAHAPTLESKTSIRSRLGLPLESVIILSVGAIDNSVKRMNYIIDEVSTLPPDYFLLMLGEQERETKDVIKYAHRMLPRKNFKITTVAHNALPDFYEAADMFVLASLSEGFGLVYLEALSAGLPVLTHDHATARFVLKQHGMYGDFTKRGVLQKMILSPALKNDQLNRLGKLQFLEDHYSWSKLETDYKAMFSFALNA